jgi:exonuclease SbcD
MADGQTSAESERRIVIGGVEALSAGIFDPSIAYVALGHLHLAQSVGKQPHHRYSGSPLPMSFAEIEYPHQIVRVDLAGETVAAIQPMAVPRAVDLLRVPATPAPLEQALAALAALPDHGMADQHGHPYLEVRIRLDQPEPGLRARIEAALKDKPVRLARIDISATPKTAGPVAPVSLAELEKLQPDEIFRQLYRQKFSNEAPPEQLAAFNELVLSAEGAPQ